MPSPARGEGAITVAAIAERTTCSNAQLWEDARLLAGQRHAVKEYYPLISFGHQGITHGRDAIVALSRSLSAVRLSCIA